VIILGFLARIGAPGGIARANAKLWFRIKFNFTGISDVEIIKKLLKFDIISEKPINGKDM